MFFDGVRIPPFALDDAKFLRIVPFPALYVHSTVIHAVYYEHFVVEMFFQEIRDEIIESERIVIIRKPQQEIHHSRIIAG